MLKIHPIYAFSDASITILNEGVVYRLHRTLLELVSPTFVSLLETVPNANPEEYLLPLPQDTPIRNDEFEETVEETTIQPAAYSRKQKSPGGAV